MKLHFAFIGLAIALILVSHPAVAVNAKELSAKANVGKRTSYKKYFNEKYGYAIDYPAFLNGEGEPDAHDGQKFSNAANPMQIRVWGCFSDWSGEDSSIQQEFDFRVKNLAGDDLPSPKITYKKTGNNWFVISGISGKKIFYQKTIKGNGVFATVLFEYPANKKEEFDQIVSHVSQSLKTQKK